MPVRHTCGLHRFRNSQPGVAYFITCCTRHRVPGLTRSEVSLALLAAIAGDDSLGDTTTVAFTLMPDHIHWLFALGSRLSLGRVVARFKARTREFLADNGMNWQRDFFEHTLHPEEDVEQYALYIFLNPYRAGLIKPDQIWSGWWCPDPQRLAFSSMLNPNGSPPPEWVGKPVPANLRTGE